MGVGVSYHISTGTKNKSSLAGADKHNERKYRRKSLGDINSYINFDLSKHNVVLIGTKNLYQDVENLYKKEFKSSVDEYNSRQKRADRKIYDYFSKIADDKKTNLYTELIIQVGDIDFWKDKTFEDKKKMVGVFEKQLELSQAFYPNFKIANATVHLDESSPHIHVVGVCSSNEELSLKNFPDRKRKKKIGLKNYVSQNEVFTKNNMKEFHQFFDKKSLELFNEVYQTNEVLNDKKFKQEYFELKVYKEYAEFIKQYEKEYSDLKKEIDNLSNTKDDLDLGMNTFKELLINSKIFDDNERNLELEFKVFKEKKVLEEEKSTGTVAPKDDNLEFVLFLLNKFNEKLKKQSENLKDVEETKKIYKEILENQKNFINDKYSLTKEQLDNIFKKAELSEILNSKNKVLEKDNKNLKENIKDLESSIIKKDFEIKTLKSDVANLKRETINSKDLIDRFKEVLPKEIVRKLQSENLSFSKIKILEEKKLADEFLKVYIDIKKENLSTINKVDLEFIQKHCETNKLLKEFTFELSDKKIIDLMTFSPALFQEKRQKEMEKVEKELDSLVKEKSNGWANKVSNDRYEKSNGWGSKVNNDKGNEWER